MTVAAGPFADRGPPARVRRCAEGRAPAATRSTRSAPSASPRRRSSCASSPSPRSRSASTHSCAGNRPSAVFVAISYVAFAAFVVVALRRSTPIASCGCFGQRRHAPDVDPRRDQRGRRRVRRSGRDRPRRRPPRRATRPARRRHPVRGFWSRAGRCSRTWQCRASHACSSSSAADRCVPRATELPGTGAA